MKILSFALAAALAAAPLMRAQVRYEDILAGLGDNWLTFMGDYSSNRHSPLHQITVDNVKNLAPKWFFYIEGAKRVGSYPVVYDGLMYVTNSNEIYALDAISGRQVWHYHQEGVEMERQNRGAAILGDRVFFVTSDCHLLALNRLNGGVVWDANTPTPRTATTARSRPSPSRTRSSSASPAAIPASAAFSKRATPRRRQAWKLWTVPAKGEPGADSWGPKTLDWGGAGTWMPGSYDPELNWLIWPTGNPWPDFYGGDRPGDNLYTDSLIAVDLDTGEMKWHFQFTPHDVGTGTARSPRCCSTSTSTARSGKSSCRPTATASSTCSTAPRASSCTPRPSSISSPGRAASTRTAARSACPAWSPTPSAWKSAPRSAAPRTGCRTPTAPTPV